VRFYRRLAESTQDEELRALYEELVAFEENHSGWLEQKVAQVRRTSGWHQAGLILKVGPARIFRSSPPSY